MSLQIVDINKIYLTKGKSEFMAFVPKDSTIKTEIEESFGTKAINSLYLL